MTAAGLAGAATGWRVFPWDRTAPPGEPFSPQYVVPAARQGKGRFDLGTTAVLYLAESPEHAAAELLRPFAGRRLSPSQLIALRRPLALVRVELATALVERIADLTDPAVLLERGIRPDALASRERGVTQAISRRLHAAGLAGFRWWSALHGDWHALLLFVDRLGASELRYGAPEALTVSHPAVRAAVDVLRMPRPRR
ncbi:MAG TPA: RES family NAD+ phosphorylase [Longimicrobium sp.]